MGNSIGIWKNQLTIYNLWGIEMSELTQEMLDAWPDCPVPGCKNKRCLALNSVFCHPHTVEQNAREQELKHPETLKGEQK